MRRPAPRRLLAALLVLLGVGAPARADDPPPGAGEALGYLGSEAVAAALEGLAASPEGRGLGARVLTYGRSAGGRPLLALRVGTETPVVLVHGGLGARDAAGTVACLEVARRVVGGAGAEVSWLLVPAPNPDALDAFLAGGPPAGGLPVDRDRDGRRGEDGPSDVDGDGEVVWMRRPLARGRWAPAAEGPAPDGRVRGDPRLLEPGGEDASRARSFERFDEGLDDDGDGAVNEDPPALDLTRGLAGWWDGVGPWRGDGPFPGHAPEARALMDLSWETTGLLAWYGFTSSGPWVLRANENGEASKPDAGLHERVAGAIEAATARGVRTAASQRGDAAPNPGSDLDWAAVQLGVPAFRIPVWWIGKEEGSAREREVADELDWLLWNDRVLGGAGFVDWHPFVHPTLGPVEIGGWRRFTRFEPPPDQLGPAARAAAAGPLVHARFRPRLEVEATVRARGGGLAEVTVRALERGGVPTDPLVAASNRRAVPVRGRLVPAPGVEVLGGPPEASFGRLDGGQASEPVVWLVRAAGGAGALGRVRIEHPVAGVAEAEVARP